MEVSERDMEDKPYNADEVRVGQYIATLAPCIGWGDDPIGFLIASHTALREDQSPAQAWRMKCDGGHEWRADQSESCPVCEKEMWGNSWKQTFHRMMAAHDDLREIYLLVAKARGWPVPKFHSVMDSDVEGGTSGKGVFANRFEPGGLKTCEGTIKSERVLDAVRPFLANFDLRRTV